MQAESFSWLGMGKSGAHRLDGKRLVQGWLLLAHDSLPYDWSYCTNSGFKMQTFAIDISEDFVNFVLLLLYLSLHPPNTGRPWSTFCNRLKSYVVHSASILTTAASRRIPFHHWIWELIHKSETTGECNNLMWFWSRWFFIWDLGRQQVSIPSGVDLRDS